MRVRQVTEILFVMFARLRTSPTHGGAGRFYYFVVTKTAVGASV